MTDQGKGAYVAIFHEEDPEWGRRGALEIRHDEDGQPIQDFDALVAQAEEWMRSGAGYSRKGVIEVVELAVTKRAVIKRAVEVSIQ